MSKDKKLDTNNIDEMIKEHLKETYGEGFSNIGSLMEETLKNAMNNLEEDIDLEAIQAEVPGYSAKEILEQAKKAKEEAIKSGTDAINAQANAMAKALNEQFFGDNENPSYEDIMAKQMEMLNQMMGDTASYNPNLQGEVSLEKVHELILEMYEELPEGKTTAVKDGDPYIRQFEILLSGVLTYINGHESNQLEVEEDDEFFKEKVDFILTEAWGIENRDDALETINWLLESGHNAEYQSYLEANSYEELIDADTDEEDKEIIKNGFEFANFFKDKLPLNIMLGWDYGRASMIVRWTYFMGYISQEEAYNLLDVIASKALEEFSSWKEYGISYIVGGLFWTYRTNPNGVYERYEETVGALVGLLDDEDPDDGDWLRNPWISDVL